MFDGQLEDQIKQTRTQARSDTHARLTAAVGPFKLAQTKRGGLDSEVAPKPTQADAAFVAAAPGLEHVRCSGPERGLQGELRTRAPRGLGRGPKPKLKVGPGRRGRRRFRFRDSGRLPVHCHCPPVAASDLRRWIRRVRLLQIPTRP